MSLALVSDGRFLDHDPGRHHPESPERLRAVLAGANEWLDALVADVPVGE